MCKHIGTAGSVEFRLLDSYPQPVPQSETQSLPTRLYLGGQWVESTKRIRVTNPYDDSLVAEVCGASPDDYSQAIALAHKTFATMRELPSHRRSEICHAVAHAIRAEKEHIARTMAMELGKAIRDCRVEVARAAGVFETAAEEAKRIGGEIVDLDWTPGTEKRMGIVRRFPRGVIAGIAPFNFPLNLVAHKIAPAIASGNCIVLKPASKTPLSALLLAHILDASSLPKGAVSVLPGSASDARPLLDDPRIRLITFTGSAEIGWWIKSVAGDKPVVLELGGNAGVIVADDADLDHAAKRLAFGAFAVAGQSCISVQRIFAHERVYAQLLDKLIKYTRSLRIGDPLDDATDVGTLVDTSAVTNTIALIDEAVAQGAHLLCGGKVSGRLMEPTILTNVQSSLAICRTEAFAPLVVVSPYQSMPDAVAMLNDSEYGLQAGVFTDRMSDILYAYKEIECGGVVINDVPTWRADHQPYGGMKRSGMGREGVRYAIDDMTELKLLALAPSHRTDL